MAVSEELKRVTSSRLNWLPGVRYADIIEFVGRVKGLKTYNAILGKLHHCFRRFSIIQGATHC